MAEWIDIQQSIAPPHMIARCSACGGVTTTPPSPSPSLPLLKICPMCGESMSNGTIPVGPVNAIDTDEVEPDHFVAKGAEDETTCEHQEDIVD